MARLRHTTSVAPTNPRMRVTGLTTRHCRWLSIVRGFSWPRWTTEPPRCETLAVFVHTLPNVTAEPSEVRQPPPRLADLLPLIRPHEAVPDTVRRLLVTLGRAGAEVIRRRRR